MENIVDVTLKKKKDEDLSPLMLFNRMIASDPAAKIDAAKEEGKQIISNTQSQINKIAEEAKAEEAKKKSEMERLASPIVERNQNPNAFIEDLNKTYKAAASLEDPFKKTETSSDLWGDAMVSFLPTIIGGMIGGKTGARAGAMASDSTMKKMAELEEKEKDRKAKSFGDKLALAEKMGDKDIKYFTALMSYMDNVNKSNGKIAPELMKYADDLGKQLFLGTQKSAEKATEAVQEERKLNIDQQKANTAAKKSAGNGSGGGKRLPPDKVLLVNEGNSIPNMLVKIDETISSNSDKFGPIMGRLTGANPYDQRAQAIESQIRAASQAFGRLMEGGVLRKEDEEKYRRMFPNLPDAPATAKDKLAIVRQLMTAKQASNIEALRNSGYDVTGIDQGIKETSLPNILGTKTKAKPMTREEKIKLLRGN